MYQLRSRLAPRAGTPGQEQHPPQRDVHPVAAAAATAKGTAGATLGGGAKGTAPDVAATESSDRQTPEPEAGRAGSQGPIKKRFKVTAWDPACTGTAGCFCSHCKSCTINCIVSTNPKTVVIHHKSTLHLFVTQVSNT